MLRLGAHESIAGGLYRALERGTSAGCESLQMWTRNSRQWEAPPLEKSEIEHFHEVRRAQDLHPLVAHASYLINIASPRPDLYRRSVDTLVDEVIRCEKLGLDYLVLHPGAHTGSGMEAGLEQAKHGLRGVLDACPGYDVRILLETTAGQGTALGGDFEALAAMLEATANGDGLGICLDTCHVFAAGHELRTDAGYAAMMTAFDKIIGLSELHVVHLNDSKYPLRSHKDRHEHIGEGYLGLEGFRRILVDPRLDRLAGILETPKSDDLHEDRENLARLRAVAAGKPASEILPDRHNTASRTD
ncbi:MAG: deoxyribonuclease IV [Anaerolineae bacterium]|nr:deoxyribonuclease IV [Anaerolineae bacterium]